MIILVMGLPGSGKTTFAKKLILELPNSIWNNGDSIRESYDDWDFSEEGRTRQAKRMKELSNMAKECGYHVIADFICPTEKLRKIFNADCTIWMNTIKKSIYEDTNKIFEEPEKFDYKIESYDQINNIVKEIINKLNET